MVLHQSDSLQRDASKGFANFLNHTCNVAAEGSMFPIKRGQMGSSKRRRRRRGALASRSVPVGVLLPPPPLSVAVELLMSQKSKNRRESSWANFQSWWNLLQFRISRFRSNSEFKLNSKEFTLKEFRWGGTSQATIGIAQFGLPDMYIIWVVRLV